MKFALIADTHDNLNTIRRAISIANDNRCEYFLHLGDVVAPFAVMKWTEFGGQLRGIFGNNDGERAGLTRAFATIGGDIRRSPRRLELGGRRILMMHDPLEIEKRAASGRYNYIFYGHLHHVDFRRVGNVAILNPGDGSGWVEAPTFCIIDTCQDDFRLVEI